MAIDSALCAHADRVLQLFKSGQKRITVSGPAGCGKTELIKYLRQQLSPDYRIHVMTFTNQAALMLRQRGIEDAVTIHSTIYRPQPIEREEIRKVRAERSRVVKEGGSSQAIKDLNETLDRLIRPSFQTRGDSKLQYKDLCIIDEASMVSEAVGRDIESFGRPVLALGDPFQLGPVGGRPHFDLVNADVKLTKVYRQGPSSEILRFASLIREGRRSEFKANGREVHIRSATQMNNDDVRAWMRKADQVICATNDTRRRINRRLLRYLGFGEPQFPQGHKNEKLICLGTYPDLGLHNGSFVRLRSISFGKEADRFFTAVVQRSDGRDGWHDCGRTRIWKGSFEHTHRGIHEKTAQARTRDDWVKAYGDGIELGIWLDWAWAVTTHKAQGNEWDEILLVTESWPTDSEVRMRMHYTGVTRARTRLRIIEDWGQSKPPTSPAASGPWPNLVSPGDRPPERVEAR
ncbi:MAG: ATP-dependent DNA helicase [bacterium]